MEELVSSAPVQKSSSSSSSSSSSLKPYTLNTGGERKNLWKNGLLNDVCCIGNDITIDDDDDDDDDGDGTTVEKKKKKTKKTVVRFRRRRLQLYQKRRDGVRGLSRGRGGTI